MNSYLKQNSNELVFRDLLELNYVSHSVSEIISRFIAAWNINPGRTIKTVIKLRYEYGEKLVFQIICFYIKLTEPTLYYHLLQEIPKIGSWKDVLQISKLSYYYNIEFDSEIELFGKNVIYDSFCAKWTPSENSHYDKKIGFAKKLMKSLDMTPKQYRQTLTNGRKKLNSIETALSQKVDLNSDWNGIISREALYKYKNCLNDVDELIFTKIRSYNEKTKDKIVNHIVKQIYFPTSHNYEYKIVEKIEIMCVKLA